MKQCFDVIVVGAGSAGCALAYRLASCSDLQVLLLEAGSAARNPLLHIPLGFAFLLKEHANNWGYYTQPEAGLGGRPVALPRGKVLGGCSAINGMVHVRGQAEDYDHWAALGNPGWSYREVLPYFRRAEDYAAGASEFHGIGGPQWVGGFDNEFPVCDAFLDAAQQAGHYFNPDINGATQEGVAWFPANIRNGRRESSASAYLKRGRKLPNLTVLTHAETRRVLLENGRAVGVECVLKGKPLALRARREVVLCGGAINSPKLLELSGIGQGDVLRRCGIDVVAELPGVGENLHDHFNGYLKYSLAGSASYYSASRPLPMLYNLLRYLFTRRSFLANPAALLTVFYRALETSERPDAQIHFSPAASEVDARGNLVPIEGVTIASCGVRPLSRGATHISSADSAQAPLIVVNYLQTAADQQLAIAAFRKAREIARSPALQALGCGELEPGDSVRSDSEILDYIRRTGEPVHHLAGSCRMGTDSMAVVDAQLRVHNVSGLRVADAAIMPQIVSGNTHAACVMIGEKAADMVLGEGA